MQSLCATTLQYELINIAIRLLVWVHSVFLYLHYIYHVDPLEYLKLKQNWQRGALIGLALSSLILFGSLLRFGLPHLALSSLTWYGFLSTSVLIGFIEAVPYRGFILQKLEQRYGFWKANFITSSLFFSSICQAGSLCTCLLHILWHSSFSLP